MKNRFILLIVILQLTACSTVRPTSRQSDNMSGAPAASSSRKSQPVFIQNISTGTTDRNVKLADAAPARETPVRAISHPVGTDDYNQLRYKYSILTETPVEDLSNLRLLIFMDQWYGVPYHYGGNTRSGIDCSAFSSLLLSDVYNINKLPRMSADQYKATKRISKRDLQEGDLVFFHTLGKGHKVTHVGIYLYNDHFVHASVSGVQISNLGEGYYLQHYVGGGRVQ